MAAPLSKLPLNFLFGDYLKLASSLLISYTKTVFVFILFYILPLYQEIPIAIHIYTITGRMR